MQALFHRDSLTCFKKVISSFIVLTFLTSLIVSPAAAQVLPDESVSDKPALNGAEGARLAFNLPTPGTGIFLSTAFHPVIITGMRIYPNNPLKFDFIIDPGDDQFETDGFKSQADKLIKYFMATLTIPEDHMWVNLSPYEKDRIIPEKFGQTEMGRDLLAQDYILKQLSSTLMYPENQLGQEFWRRVYERSQQRFGTTEIPINSFNKIWIVPDKAVIYEQGDTTFVVENHLKVMLEEDYVSMQKSLGIQNYGLDSLDKADAGIVNQVSADVIRQVLVPEIEREVNEGKNFANLRQIYNSMLLATWYKRNLRESLLGKVYVDQKKIKGIDVEDKNISEKIFYQYVQAFKKGVYNKIREEYDPVSDSMIPKKYFLGGMTGYGEIQRAGSGVRLSAISQNRVPYNVSVDLLEYSKKNSALSSGDSILGSSSPLTQFDGFEFGVWTEEDSIKQAVGIFSRMKEFLQTSFKGLDNSIPVGIFLNQRLRSLMLSLMDEVLKEKVSPEQQKAKIHQRLKEDLFNDSDFVSSIRSTIKSTDVYEDSLYEESDDVMLGRVEDLFGKMFNNLATKKSIGLSKFAERFLKFDKELYALVQWDLNNRFPQQTTLKLVRGSWEYEDIHGNPSQKGMVNLPAETYFTDDPSTAEAFGDIYQAEVPFERILSVWWISPLIIGEDLEPEFTVSQGPMEMSVFYLNGGENTEAQRSELESQRRIFRQRFAKFETLAAKLRELPPSAESSQPESKPPKDLIFENDFKDWLEEHIVEPLDYDASVESKSLQILRATINYWLDPNAERDLARKPNGKQVRNRNMAKILTEVARSIAGNQEIAAQLIYYRDQLSKSSSSAVGGINFNPAILDLQIKRNSNGVPLKLEFQSIENINIEGFIPVIIDVVPVSLPSLLEINNMPSS